MNGNAEEGTNDGRTNGAPFTTASVHVPVDADGNGINDDWELAYFGRIGADPNADQDGDGASNLEEFLAGTDPTNNASVFRIIAISKQGNDIRLTWTAASGRTNLLERTTGAGLSFSNNYNVIFTVTNTLATNSYIDAGAATNYPGRCYRVRLVP